MSRAAAPPFHPSLARLRPGELVVTVTAVVAFALLLVFVLWPVLRVAVLSVRGADGFTLAHYAEFFGTWRLARILVQSLTVAAVSTLVTIAVAVVLAYAVTR